MVIIKWSLLNEMVIIKKNDIKKKRINYSNIKYDLSYLFLFW